MIIVSLSSSINLSKTISDELNCPLIIPKIKKYSFDELEITIDFDVNLKNIVIIGSITSSSSLIELLLIIDTLKKFSPKNITAVIPYMCYSRQEPKNHLKHKSFGIGLVAKLLKTLDLIITIDIHSKDSLDLFKIPVINLETTDIFAQDILKKNNYKNAVIVSPDKGSTQRAINLANKLNLDFALINKTRNFDKYEMKLLKGDISNKDCIIVDDMIDSGNTLIYALKLLLENNAKSISAYVTHGVFSKDIKDLKNICITDTIESLIPLNAEVLTTSVIITKALKNCLLC